MSGGMFDHLGETFVVLRLLRGLSQAELADRAGIRSNQISRYETGQVLPQLGQLERILTALGVGMPELLFTMSHLERTAHLLEQGKRPTVESLVGESVAVYWRQVSDLHLRISQEVIKVLEGELTTPPGPPTRPAGDAGEAGADGADGGA